ncbi:MAG: hypothetical protein A2W31_09515 [Planctomycetes bacterium RBG_16_64_10]|nr:MAG: hypothetical protein A2W31_09515 [Planctomycetes bacterium RBG_16_64_10]
MLAEPAGAPQNVPPEGFTALFNGQDLSGWFGLDGRFNGQGLITLGKEAREKLQREGLASVTQHWKVEQGELVNDGAGLYLTTDQDYGDIELWIDCKIQPKGDSGIYLRGTPQVQIWDTTEAGGQWQHGADKGSGCLWNNKQAGNRALVLADRPPGEWNRFHIRMIGPRTTVHLNDQLVVDDIPLENYWDRTVPLPARGPIQLQTHGGETRFRNIFVREIPAEEANAHLQAVAADGFEPVFNGRDFDGWIGATDSYEIQDGILRCKSGTGGVLLTGKTYGDFAVRFEFRLPPGGNNGLAIRAPLEGNPAYEGLEIQILEDSAEKYADLKDWQVHGSVYGLAPARRGFLRPVGQWNVEEVVVQGSRVTVCVNGTTINDVDLQELPARDGQEHPGRTRPEGHLGFLGHGDPVEFRNIRVKLL